MIQKFVAVDYRAQAQGTRKGFVDIEMPSGMKIRGCTWHESDGKEWVGLPGTPHLDRNKQPILNAAGKIQYTPVVELTTPKAREHWQMAALDAIHGLLGRDIGNDHDGIL